MGGRGWVLVFERHHDMAVGLCRYVGMYVWVRNLTIKIQMTSFRSTRIHFEHLMHIPSSILSMPHPAHTVVKQVYLIPRVLKLHLEERGMRSGDAVEKCG